jgi:protoheme ferro-lyase
LHGENLAFLGAADPLFNLTRNSADHLTQISTIHELFFKSFSRLTPPSISHKTKRMADDGNIQAIQQKAAACQKALEDVLEG